MHNFHIWSSYDFIPVEGPVGRLAGTMLAPMCKIGHNQVLPGKYNTKVHSLASSGPIRPGKTDHRDIPKPVYGIRTGPDGERVHNRTGVPKPVDRYGPRT